MTWEKWQRGNTWGKVLVTLNLAHIKETIPLKVFFARFNLLIKGFITMLKASLNARAWCMVACLVPIDIKVNNDD